MSLARVEIQGHLWQRVCLSCGFRGPELQRDDEHAAYHCPGCGQDLYARPPRSYAEMEGLARPAPPAPACLVTPPCRPASPPRRRSRLGVWGRFVLDLFALATGLGECGRTRRPHDIRVRSGRERASLR